jgi:hypothetical protein
MACFSGLSRVPTIFPPFQETKKYIFDEEIDERASVSAKKRHWTAALSLTKRRCCEENLQPKAFFENSSPSLMGVGERASGGMFSR